MATARKRKSPSRKQTTRRPAVKKQEVIPSIYTSAPSSQPSTILIILFIIIAFFAGYLFFKVQSLEKGVGTGQLGPQGQQVIPTRPSELKIKKPTTGEHWRGSANARYVWVEYSDLECPFCKQIHPNLQKLMSENEGKVAWVFRHFPLSFHPKADPSAQAVECAAELGGNDAFWKAVDAIYEKMPSVELSGIPVVVASATGTDATAIKNCTDSKKHDKVIKDDQSEGQKAGVQATPTNVIYDLQTGKTKLLEGALPYEQLKQGLEDFMK